MISYNQFKNIVVNELQRDISSNNDQNIAISSKKDQSLFIVAGPGSGKTTVMVLKILKFIFVDDVNPNEIVATTFTRKAANELHSRILSWGDDIKRHLSKNISDDEIKNKINRIDFNQIITGTIDSIAEEILRIYREPGTNLPVVIEEFVANAAMINSGLFNNDSYLDKDLRKYLGTLIGVEEVKNPSKMSDILLDIKNRLYYDQVDFYELMANETVPGAKKALDIIANYIKELNNRNIIDFPMLESIFLKKLKSEKLNLFLDEIKVILVDEYQDTNLLQEKIYFTLAKSAIANGGNITVVGDDDQSLYRFRGATVDLFTNFSKRAREKLNTEVKEVNLSVNYRSTEHIIDLCNHFVELDDIYQSARVKEKPKIKYPKSNKDMNSQNIGLNNTKLTKSTKTKNTPPNNTKLTKTTKTKNTPPNNTKLTKSTKTKNTVPNNTKLTKPTKTKNTVPTKSMIQEKIEVNQSNFQEELGEITVPVLGMFRQNPEMLAKDLSILIKDLVEGKEIKKKIKRVLRPNSNISNNMNNTGHDNYNISNNMNNTGHDNSILNKYASNKKEFKSNENSFKKELLKNNEIKFRLDEKNGSPSDIAILTYSPKELSYGNQLFPHYLRKNLAKFKTQIDVFNPRGQDLQTLKPVAIFCGLILECIDPEAKFQKSIKKIPKLAERNMNKWRRIANEYIELSPEPHQPISLKDFVDKWRSRIPYNHKNLQGHEIWPETASLIELAYKLITWIETLQEDAEGIVYLQAITQTITQTGFFNEFSGSIHFDDEHILEKKSVLEAIWNIFIPIATGGVTIDENLLDTLPNNRINIMSIHQSKGLEFPLVIVDVGSRFNKNRVNTSFLRFPKEGGKSAKLENKIRAFSDLGIGEREARDKAFDDLTRLYFVAFSRAKDVLLLIGLNSTIDGYMANDEHKKIPNIALGWKRDEVFVGFDEIFLI
ncbi:ATP-dependent DNA helicase UvrD1 [Methanobrevibacter cuticularis]|uniref:DNA 3'-5' helicase n=1 Tax=Methanobrevibacter cuticularis TaxID=47311 RepID=A0A166FC32_9EURY|nr:DEAD/DEAH box helicase [Methanobrevibacter cuticularis]KZX17520.1 ATP-dependent DNA helicase UvrD1 [Methanobrevibacter cuticularis]